MPPLPAPTTLPPPGTLFEAPWGSYVYKGAAPQNGRLPLIAVGGASSVLVALERLETDYRRTGHQELPCPPRAVSTRPAAPAPTASSGAAGTRPPEPPARPTDTAAAFSGAVVLPPRATPPPSGSPLETRRTLGAVRPPSNTVGMVKGELGGGTYTSIPGKETLFWLPCRVYATELPEPVPAILCDGTEEHPARPSKPIPHAFFIASSLRFSMSCTGCRRPQPQPAPALTQRPPQLEASEVPPRGADPVVPAALAEPVADVVDVAGLGAGVQPVLRPLGEIAVTVPHADTRRAEAATSDTAIAPPDDPKESLGDFSRPHRDPVPPKGAPVYRPHRVDFERGEYWGERAAIFEYLGDHDRWISERMALEETIYAQEQGQIR